MEAIHWQNIKEELKTLIADGNSRECYRLLRHIVDSSEKEVELISLQSQLSIIERDITRAFEHEENYEKKKYRNTRGLLSFINELKSYELTNITDEFLQEIQSDNEPARARTLHRSQTKRS